MRCNSLIVAMTALTCLSAGRAEASTVALARVGATISANTQVGERRFGLFCHSTSPIIWSEVAWGPSNFDELKGAFAEAMEAAGIPSTGQSSLTVEATVTEMRTAICDGISGEDGTGTISVDWKVLDATGATLADRITTTADADVQGSPNGADGGPLRLSAFERAAESLASRPEFRKALRP